jgi:hypothetical protein
MQTLGTLLHANALRRPLLASEAAATMIGGAYGVYLQSGEIYLVRPADGAISRQVLDWRFSGQWLLRGVRLMPIKGASWSRGKFVPVGQLLDFITRADRESLWTYKNGSGRIVGCDLDHGSNREWGETICAIRFIKGA